jgi:hypothetical protein
MRLIVITSLSSAAFITGCATTIDGAEAPPAGWHSTPSGNCVDIAGTYSSMGLPAPGNSRSGMYNVVWPVAGSLVSMIENGANGTHLGGSTRVLINVEGPSSVKFSALDREGRAQQLSARQWHCRGSELTTRALLSRLNPPEHSDVIEESVMRLWKSDDGALIAEDSIERAKWHADAPPTNHQALARFYFRFAPVERVAGNP